MVLRAVSLPFVLLAFALWSGQYVASESSPTDECLDVARNSSAGCQVFHSCCEQKCGGENFTATCAEERSKLIGTCICKGTPSNDTSQSFKCGRPTVRPKKPSAGRIVGGEEAKANSWPWQVSLVSGFGHFCGGSLVGPRHVVTAGHCVENPNRNITVRVGLHDKQAPQSSYQSVQVDKVIRHPGYDAGPGTKGPANDVAVLRLATPVKFNANVTPICFPKREPAPGKVCVTTGWGRTKGTGDDNLLQQVAMPVLSQSVCNGTKHHNGDIDDTMICIFSEGKSGCHGDSGGPMVCELADGTWELQGAVSWGSAECEKKPSVFNRIFQSQEWIKEVMNANQTV